MFTKTFPLLTLLSIAGCMDPILVSDQCARGKLISACMDKYSDTSVFVNWPYVIEYCRRQSFVESLRDIRYVNADCIQ